MSKSYSILFLILFCIYSLNCQQSELKLKGKPISSEGSSESLLNAFDGDLSTQFISPLNNGWVGLDLSSPAKITKIGFSHISSEPKDYLLGIFEGANDETFFDAFPLYMITKEVEPNKINYIQISCPQTFRYIRYVGPEKKNSTISEFEIFGNLESSEGNEKETDFYQPTNIPLLIINSGNSEMPQNRDRQTKTNCNFILLNKGKIEVKKTGTIKLRGNSSLDSEKKPYLINFDDKTNFLEMPSKAKKWVLIPNMYDKTLMRNLLGYKMSFIFGLKFTPTCKYIDLIVNGNYRGNYLICDKIEVSKERIDISKMDETCIAEPEITGGYLVEAKGSAKKTDPSLFKTTNGITLSIEYPDIEDVTEEQMNYIKNKFNSVEKEIYDNNTESIDLESFTRYFLVEDFSANQDGIFNSVYFYKERGDDKIYFGPVWDFDLAFDNAMILYPTNEKKNFAFKFGLSNGTMRKLLAKLLSDEKVLQKVKDTWNEMTNTVFTKEIIRNFIDEQIEYINESQKLNFIRWDVLNSRQFMEAVLRGSFEAEVEYLKQFMDNRFDIFGEILSNATPESIAEDNSKKNPWGDWGNWGDWGDWNNPWGGNNGFENKNGNN